MLATVTPLAGILVMRFTVLAKEWAVLIAEAVRIGLFNCSPSFYVFAAIFIAYSVHCIHEARKEFNLLALAWTRMSRHAHRKSKSKSKSKSA